MYEKIIFKINVDLIILIKNPEKQRMVSKNILSSTTVFNVDNNNNNNNTSFLSNKSAHTIQYKCIYIAQFKNNRS